MTCCMTRLSRVMTGGSHSGSGSPAPLQNFPCVEHLIHVWVRQRHVIIGLVYMYQIYNYIIIYIYILYMGADQNICKIKNYEKGMCILINTHIYIYMYRDTYSFFASGASWSSLWHQGRELFFLQPRTMVQRWFNVKPGSIHSGWWIRGFPQQGHNRLVKRYLRQWSTAYIALYQLRGRVSG